MSRRLLLPVVFLILLSGCSRAPVPETLYPAPEAQLTTDSGQPFRLSNLKGKVAVYDFIFTRCSGPCPLMSQQMARLVADFDEPDLRFVSVSVDPTYDTPPVLSSYAARFRKDPRWMFLTGDRDSVGEVSVDGFKLAVGGSGSESDPILHSTKFVLVDRQGMIRGYYEALDETGRAALKRDLRAVLAGN